MIGLIDIGNTRLKWAVANEGSEIIADGAFAYKGMSTKEIEQSLIQCFIGGALEKQSLHSIAISCVGAPNFLELVIENLKQRFQVTIDVLTVSKDACGIKNSYDPIIQLGIDRWMSVIGSRSNIGQGAVIVIDAGTAVKVEYLSADNVYEGGVILPGFDLMHDSLVSSTSKIHSEKIEGDKVIGTNTCECVNSGAHYGVGGAVDRVVKEMKLLMQSDSTIILAGGSAARLASVMVTPINAIDPHLVFKGMIEVLK